MKKEKKFKLFDLNRDGKGVDYEESRKPTLAFFFKLWFRKFSQLIQLNVLMLLQALPILIIAFLYFAGTKTPTTTEYIYAPLYGMSISSPSPSITTLLDMSAIQMELPVLSPVAFIVVIVMVVVFALLFGVCNVGSAYVLRGLYRGDAVFVFSDFFYGIKRNFKQAFVFGLIDFIICGVLVGDFMFFYSKIGSFQLDFMFFTISALAIVYIIMHFYMYQLLITFDLSSFKILKNSLIFTILGIKRNIMAILGIVVLAAIHIALILLLLPLGIAIPLVLPLVYIFSLVGFITTYAAFPVIDKYMIQPYLASQQTNDALNAPNDEI